MRSEENSGTTEIGWGGLALKILEKQTACWRGCGYETPSIRRAGWEGSAVMEQPTGDMLRPRRKARPPSSGPFLHCPTAAKTGFSLDSCHPSL